MSNIEFPYFTEEHEDYLHQLGGIEELNNFKTSLSQNVNISKALCKKLNADIEELEGDSADELRENTIGSLVSQCEKEADDVDIELEGVKAKCDDLNKSLPSLKSESSSLIVKMSESSCISDDKEKIEQIASEIRRLTNECVRLRKISDPNIEALKSFDEKIKNLTTQLFSLSLTLGDVDFSGFRNLSTEEKERLIQNFIDSLRNRYEELSKYKDLLVGSFTPEKIQQLNIIIGSFGNGELSNIILNNVNKQLDAEDLIKLMEILTTKITYTPYGGEKKRKSVIDIINSYFNGESWEQSGMFYLSHYFHSSNNPDPAEDEKKFMETFVNCYLDGGDSCTLYSGPERINGKVINDLKDPEKLREIFENIKKGYVDSGELAKTNDIYNEFTNNYEQYNNTVGEMVSCNTASYSFENLKKQLPYFEYAGEEAFETFDPDISQFNQDWLKDHKLDQGIADGYDYNELFNNMSDEEKIMFAYCIERNGGTEAKNLEAGRKFLRDSADRINQRVGFNKAQEFVDWINDKGYVTRGEYEQSLRAAGTYTEDQIQEKIKFFPEKATLGQLAIDEVCDLGNCFFKGTSCGFNQFTQNIQNLWEPDKVMTVNEYETSAIMSLFGDARSESYRPECLAAFNCGQTVGKDGIKTILKAIPSPVTKTIGTVLDIADRTGASRNKYYRESGDYTASFYHASFDALSETAIDYLAKTDKAKELFNGLGNYGKDALKYATGVGKSVTKIGIDRGFDIFEGRDVGSVRDYAKDLSTSVFNVGVDTLVSSINSDHSGGAFIKTAKDALTTNVGNFAKATGDVTISEVYDFMKQQNPNYTLDSVDWYPKATYSSKIADAINNLGNADPDYGTEFGKFTLESAKEIAKGNKEDKK